MPRADAALVTTVNGTAEFGIWYNDSNMRVTQVEWRLPEGSAARCRIYNSGALVYDEVKAGTGAQNVPGNFRMVNTPDGPDLPPELTYDINIQML